MMFRQSETKDVHWFVGYAPNTSWTFYHIRHIPIKRQSGSDIFDELTLHFTTKYNNIHRMYADQIKLKDKANELEGKLKEAYLTISEMEAEIARSVQSRQQVVHEVVGIACTFIGASVFVFGGVLFVLWRRWRASASLLSHVLDHHLSGTKEHRIDMSDCGTRMSDESGVNRFDDVTAGDIDSRILSEDKTDIQPIYQDQEEKGGAELQGTVPEDTKQMEVWRRNSFWAGWEFP